MSALWTRLGARAMGPLALVLMLAFTWQTARIEGLPLIGGGLKDAVARLEKRIVADELARAKAETALLAAQARRAEAANHVARAYEDARRVNDRHIRTVIEKVPVHVSQKSDRACVLPWGAVRLLDAAASGADPDLVAARIAPGQPDDAASGIALSEVVTLLAGNLAIARGNADQLRHLQRAVSPDVDYVSRNRGGALGSGEH